MGVTLKLDGLERVRKNAEKLHGRHQVSANDMFTDKFMRANTKFETWNQMLDAYGVKEAEDVEDPAFDQFVSEMSEFANFQSMCEAGAAEYMTAKLFE